MALTLSDKYELARLVGRLNRSSWPATRFRPCCSGPGRWGTSTPRLGVPVRFAEINAMTAIAEVAFSAGGLQPELSFGTHFFQDLVETGIFYVALNPDRLGCLLNAGLLTDLPNRLAGAAARRRALRGCGPGRGLRPEDFGCWRTSSASRWSAIASEASVACGVMPARALAKARRPRERRTHVKVPPLDRR